MRNNRTITIPFLVIFMTIVALSFSSTKAYGTSPKDSSSISQLESTDSLQNGTMNSQQQNEAQQNTADSSVQQCDNSSTDDVIDDENPKRLNTKELISYIILLVNLLLILTLLILFIVYNHKSKKSIVKSLKTLDGNPQSTKSKKKDKNEYTNDSLGNEQNRESLANIATELQQQINSLSTQLTTLIEGTRDLEQDYSGLKDRYNAAQDFEKQIEELNSKCMTLENENKTLGRQKESLETDKKELDKKLEQAEQAVREKDKAIEDALKEERSQYDNIIEGLNSQLKRYSDYIKDYVGEFKDDSGNNKKLNEIKEAFSSFNKNAARLFELIEELNKQRINLNNAVLNDKSISDDDKNVFVQFYSHYVSKYEDATKEINSLGLEHEFKLLNQSGMVPKDQIIDKYLKESIRDNYIDDLREKAFDRGRLGELCGASVVFSDDLGTALPSFCPNAVRNESKCIKKIKELSKELRDSTKQLGYTIVTDVTLITKKGDDYPSDKVKALNDDTRLNRKQKFGEGSILEVRKLAVMCGEKGDKETLVITE